MLYDELDDIGTSDFSQSIRSMDDKSFALFIKTSFGGASSTPKKTNQVAIVESIRSSASHDPFDDSLDNVLMNVKVKETAKKEDDTDDDEKDVQEYEPEYKSDHEQYSGPLKTASLGDLNNNVVIQVTNSEEILSNERLVPNTIEKIDSAEGDNEQKQASDSDDGDDNSEDDISIGKPHDFGDYTTYFENKKNKQQAADKAYIEWENKRNDKQDAPPQIFRGCEIHVNGHTVPSINEIHRLVILYGGKFVNYLNNKNAATHIVCDRLTPRKRIQFKNYKVVKAQWIVDSIEKGQLLNWSDYRLIDNVSYGQQRLTLSKEVDPNEEKIKENEEYKSKQNVEIGDLEVPYIGADIDGEGEEIVPLTESQEELDQEFNLSQSGETHIESLNHEPKRVGMTLDARHPDFLKHFFAYSRLHHLSSWKADLRAFFLKKIMETSKSQRKPKSNGNTNENSRRIILHVDFDCFFATASALNRPDLDMETQPIAVSHGGRTSDVSSCNYVARKFGVKNGMWVGQAKKLCPQLITLGYDFDLYEKFSNSLYNYLIDSQIFDSIFPVLIDEVLLDATTYINGLVDIASDTENVINDFSTEVNAMAKKIKDDIFNLTKCTISVGVSSNVLLAKLCLRKAKPNGQLYLEEDPQKIYDFLSNIPVRDLPGIGGSIVQKLTEEIQNPGSKIEVPTISHLRHLSESRLKTIFGEKTGLKLFQYLRGIDMTSIDIKDGLALKRKSVSVDVNYGIRFDNVEQLDIFLLELAKELYRRLMHISMCGSSITLRLARRALTAPVDPAKFLGMGHCTFVNKTSKFGVPTNDWGVVGSELKALYRMLNVPVHDLRGIAITMSNLVDVEALKKNRQKRLPFKVGTKDALTKEKHKKVETDSTSADYVNSSNTLRSSYVDQLDIDWEVFQELPSSIKKELQDEISRRGMQVRNVSPSKNQLKVFMQQLIPVNGGLEYSKVVESPKKVSPKNLSPRKTSPTKRKLRTKSTSSLPVKKSRSNTPFSGPNYLESAYDESVIKELPPDVREEILRDLQMRLKPVKGPAYSEAERIKMTPSWIAKKRQELPILHPLFQNKLMSFPELKLLFTDWIGSSLLQGGPHMDDVHMVLDHLEELLLENNLLRSVSIVKFIKVRVDCEKINTQIKEQEETYRELIKEGFQEWDRVIHSDLEPVLERYCVDKGIDIDYTLCGTAHR